MWRQWKREIDNGGKLETNVVERRSCGALDDGVDKLVELVFVNALDVGAVTCVEDVVGDGDADLFDDGIGGAHFSTDDGLADLVGCFVGIGLGD